MGEAKRRGPQRSEMRMVPVGEIAGSMCGWQDCDATLADSEPAVGWVRLIIHSSPPSAVIHLSRIEGERRSVLDLDGLAWRHDKALCPKHARALDELLKPGSALLTEPAAGQA